MAEFSFGFVILDVIPFLLLVILPVVGSTLLAMKLSRSYDERELPSLLPFFVTLVVFALGANLFWNAFVYNHFYYEWDRILPSFTFLYHEAPLLNDSVSWIASGWSLWQLDLLWIGITLWIYLAAGIVSLLFVKDKDLYLKNIKVISYSVLLLLGFSIVASFIWPVALVILLFIVFKSRRGLKILEKKIPNL